MSEGEFGLVHLHPRRKCISKTAGLITQFLSSLDSYKPHIDKRTLELLGCVERRSDANGIVNLSEAVRHWSYDVMVSRCHNQKFMSLIQQTLAGRLNLRWR